MAAIIDSAPDCITREAGTEEDRVEDSRRLRHRRQLRRTAPGS